MVKLANRAITATTNGYLLTNEELATVFVECEAMLNNRPLTYVGCDPDDVDPITPAHFLNTRHLTPLLPSEVPLENVSPKRRWYDGCTFNRLYQRCGKDGKMNTFLAFNDASNGTSL